MTQWPYEKTESRQAYEDYRTAGGPLDWYAWLAAGEPSATEEGASNAWLGSLATFLQAQIDSRAISLDEAVLISDDMEDRLFGLGKYEGARQTVIDLPTWVQTDVENYRKSLPIQEQRRLEDEARATQQQAQTEQQQAQDIASQRMKLPLGAGGTIPQQINAGQLAIRNLQIQLGAAPEHMQGTLRGQITDLERGVEQLRKLETDMARARMEKEEPTVVEEHDYGPPTKEFAEKYTMSPGAAYQTGIRYASNPEGPEFADLTLEQRIDLNQVANETEEDPFFKPEPVKPFEDIPTFGEIGTSGSPTWKRWFEQRYPTIVSQFKGKEGGERTEAGWTTFLEKERARIKSEFTKQTPYSRGERPGAFAPKIKTVNFG